VGVGTESSWLAWLSGCRAGAAALCRLCQLGRAGSSPGLGGGTEGALCAVAGAGAGTEGSGGVPGFGVLRGAREAAPPPPHDCKAQLRNVKWRGRHLACRSPKNNPAQACLSPLAARCSGFNRKGWREPRSQLSWPLASRTCARRSQPPASAVTPKPPCSWARGSQCHPPGPGAAPFSHCKLVIFQLDSREGEKKVIYDKKYHLNRQQG